MVSMFPLGSSVQVYCNQSRKFFPNKDVDVGKQATDSMKEGISREPREDEINESSATNDLASDPSMQEEGRIFATPFTKFFSIQGQDYGERLKERVIDLIKRTGWIHLGFKSVCLVSCHEAISW